MSDKVPTTRTPSDSGTTNINNQGVQRLEEDGTVRIEEDGTTRVLEDTVVVTKTPTQWTVKEQQWQEKYLI